MDEHQVEVVEFARRNGLIVLSGKPGSGKTTTTKSVVEAWLDQDERRVLVTSTSAVATVRAFEVIGHAQNDRVDYATIASVFEHADLAKRLDFSCLIVDEVGMCSAHQLASLLDPEFIKWKRVMLVGDRNQLRPVGSPSCFSAIQAATELECFFHLTKVYRQGNQESALVKNIELVDTVIDLRGEQLTRDETFHLLTSDFSESDIRRVVQKVCQISFRGGSPPPQFIAITNETCAIVNSEVQKQTQLQKATHEFINSDGKRTYANYVGDLVVCRENYPKTKRKRLMPDIANGQMGRVIKVQGRGACLQFKELVMDHHKVVHELGYCVTLHRAQGNEWDRVVLMFNIGRMRGLIDRKYLTVGLSRAKRHLLLVANEDDLKQATRIQDEPPSSLLARIREEIIDPDEFDQAFQLGYSSYIAKKQADEAKKEEEDTGRKPKRGKFREYSFEEDEEDTL